MSKVYPCPHCRTQNFATPGRLRKAPEVPLTCWKCGKEIRRKAAPSAKKKSPVKSSRGKNR